MRQVNDNKCIDCGGDTESCEDPFCPDCYIKRVPKNQRNEETRIGLMGETSKYLLLTKRKRRLQDALHTLVKSTELTDEEVVNISQELDKVIIELMKLINK